MANDNPNRPTPATNSDQITETVLQAVDDTPDPRVKEIVMALIRHAHDLAREVRLLPDELLAAAHFLKSCGEISDQSRHEFILLSDVLGLTMVVDTLAAEVPDGALETSVLGPFYRAAAPLEPFGANIARGTDDGEPAHIFGTVRDTSGAPVSGAELDVWGTNHKGLYENVDPDQPDFNLRGRFITGPDGRYDIWTVKPVSYPIPNDGPVGGLLKATARHNMRPGHLHLMVAADGFRTIATELYNDDDPFLHSDAVFGVKPSLVVHYDRVGGTRDPGQLTTSEWYWELAHDLVLTPGQRTSISFTTTRGSDS